MSLIVVHLRWKDPGPDRYAELIRAIPEDGDLPPGCLSRQLRREGGAVLAIETWDDEQSGGRMDDLVTVMRSAGMEESPQTAMFSVPAMFAVAYRRPAGATVPEAAEAVTIPTPRRPSSLEEVPVSAAAVLT